MNLTDLFALNPMKVETAPLLTPEASGFLLPKSKVHEKVLSLSSDL